MFHSAMTRPNSFAASMNSGLLPGLDPQKTQILLIRCYEDSAIFSLLFGCNSGCVEERNEVLNL